MVAPRFPQLNVDKLDAAQKPLAERVTAATHHIGGPFSIILRSPGMAEGMIAQFEYFRFKAPLDRRLKELAILMLAREWTAQYEWYAHKQAAVTAGLDEGTIEELRQGKRPSHLKPDEAVVYDFGITLIRRHEVDDATFAAARELLGERSLIDLTALIGEYMKVALILNMGRVGVPAGQELPLPPLAARAP
jgi:4-carboxymuconolactone decarboxylase